MNKTDTIAALSTAPGEAAISVVRISGPDAFAVADCIFEQDGLPPSRRKSGSFIHGIVRDKQGRRIDEALLLIMRGPRSYTGEDVVEIQGHGGMVVPRQVLRACFEAGCRAADPGEFTRRAFLNGKRDLLQAEAVLDLIRARTERAASAAIEQMEGVLTQQLKKISQTLLSVAVEMEARIDFPEEDFPRLQMNEQRAPLEEARNTIRSLLSGWEEGRLLREGARVVLLGRPNVGKSTLFNALLGFDRAIVTPHPGTTRDTLEEGLILGGIAIRLIDTAGLRDSDCPIEREGVERTRRHAPGADVILHILDASQPPDPEDADIWARYPGTRRVVIVNKIDLGRCVFEQLPKEIHPVEACLTEQKGLDTIRQAIQDRIERLVGGSIKPHAVIAERHRAILEETEKDISEAIRLAEEGSEDMVVPAIACVRSSLEKLGELTGRVYQDDLLDGIFSRFCIGK